MLPLAAWLPLILAAEFEMVPMAKKRINDFESFTHELGRTSVASCFDRLVPLWRQQLLAASVSDEKPQFDSQFAKDLAYLRNPDLPQTQSLKRLFDPIREHLQLMHGKIASLLSSVNDETPLQEYTRQLMQNTEELKGMIATLGSKDEARYAEGYTVANLLDLVGSTQDVDGKIHFEGYFEKYYPRNLKSILEGDLLEMSPGKIDQLHFAWHAARLLMHSAEVMPDDNLNPLIENLIHVRESIYLKGKGENLQKVLALLPIGKRVALGFKSSSHSCILDLIKAEDGHVYGIKYATCDTFHASTLAFRTPAENLPKLGFFLTEKYGPTNDINWADFEIQTKKVDLPWFPASPAATNTFQIVLNYALGWGIGNRLVIGAIGHVCQAIGRFKAESPALRLLQKPNYWIGLVDRIKPQEARLLLPKVANLKVSPKIATSPSFHEASNLLKSILDRLQEKASQA